MTQNAFKQLLVTIAILFTSFTSLFAASPIDSIKWGIEQPYHKRGYQLEMHIFKSDDKYIYYWINATKNLNDNYFIVKHEIATGINTYCDFKKKIEKFDLDPEHIEYYNDSLHVFSYYEDSKKPMTYLIHETYNIEKMQPDNNTKILAEFPGLLPGVNPRKYFEKFKITHTNNQLIVRNKYYANGGQNTAINIYDESMNKVWGTKSNSFPDSRICIEKDYCSDVKGYIYAFQQDFEKEKHINSNFEKSKQFVVCYPKNGNNPIFKNITLGADKFITYCKLSVNEFGDVICAGLYSKTGVVDPVGCFSIILSEQLSTIKSINTKEFSAEFLAKGKDLKEISNIYANVKDINNFNQGFGYLIKDVHYNSNGEFDIVAEKYMEEIEYINGYNTQYYYYDDLLVIKFNQNGSVKWTQKIPKYYYVTNTQEVSGNYFLSYDNNENMNFIFNIGRTNFFTNNIIDSKTIGISLDKNGNEKFYKIEDNKDISQYICPRLFYVHDNKTIAVLFNYKVITRGVANSKNTIKFGELKLKQ